MGFLLVSVIKKPLCRQRRHRGVTVHVVPLCVAMGSRNGRGAMNATPPVAAHKHISRTHNPRSPTPLTADDGDSLTEGWTDSFRSQILLLYIIHALFPFVKYFGEFFSATYRISSASPDTLPGRDFAHTSAWRDICQHSGNAKARNHSRSAWSYPRDSEE